MENTEKYVSVMPGMVVHPYNLSIWEAEAGESQVKAQPELHSETLSQKTNASVLICTCIVFFLFLSL
jgi:hypothetical protein